MELLISNVKISCKIRLVNNVNSISFNTDTNNSIKHYNNFTVVKKKYSYIVFTKSKLNQNFHVNITKIPQLDHISKALDELKDIISSPFVIEKFKIENLTCLHHFKDKLNLGKIYEKCKPNEYYGINQIRYDLEKFPAMFITLTKCSALVFSSGKIVIIGASSEHNAREGLESIFNMLKMSNIM